MSSQGMNLVSLLPIWSARTLSPRVMDEAHTDQVPLAVAGSTSTSDILHSGASSVTSLQSLLARSTATPEKVDVPPPTPLAFNDSRIYVGGVMLFPTRPVPPSAQMRARAQGLLAMGGRPSTCPFEDDTPGNYVNPLRQLEQHLQRQKRQKQQQHQRGRQPQQRQRQRQRPRPRQLPFPRTMDLQMLGTKLNRETHDPVNVSPVVAAGGTVPTSQSTCTEGSAVKKKSPTRSEAPITRCPPTPVLSQRTEQNVGESSITTTPSLLVYEHKQEHQMATATEGEIRGDDTSPKDGISTVGPWGDMMITPATINRRSNG